MQKVINKTARRDYEILDTMEVGIALMGGEVKSIKQGRLQLDSAYVKFVEGDLRLINAQIPQYIHAHDENYDPIRSRVLLLHKKEAIHLQSKLAQATNRTIIPLSCYCSHGKIKLEIALAKGKKLWEKKRVEKDRSEARRQEIEIKEVVKKRG